MNDTRLCPEYLQTYFAEQYEPISWVTRSAYVTATINTVSAVPATFLNLLVIVAILRSNTLRSPSFLLICSMAVSDFMVGVVLQPRFTVLRVAEIMGEFGLYCKAAQMGSANSVGMLVSVITAALISIDRYLALHLRMRYNVVVTRSRVVKMIVMLWFVSICLGALVPLISMLVFTIFLNAIVSMLVPVIVVCYVKCFHTLRQQRNKIGAANIPLQRAKVSGTNSKGWVAPALTSNLGTQQNTMQCCLEDYLDNESSLASGVGQICPSNQVNHKIHNNLSNQISLENQGRPGDEIIIGIEVRPSNQVSPRNEVSLEKQAHPSSPFRLGNQTRPSNDINLENQVNPRNEICMVNEACPNNELSLSNRTSPIKHVSLGKKIIPSNQSKHGHRKLKRINFNMNLVKYENVSFTMLLIIINLFMCYTVYLVFLPLLYFAIGYNGTVKFCSDVGMLLVSINSALNPIIYLMRMREIRNSIWALMREP
ncbi:dopamine receptor 4 [Nematostella vectensis]|uniref:dopamine receptor 4 n=1 Tax=Nematostella vectensis TaxID=45351 RepID=UPI0020773F57|nr:dopamine receptor 4 [Nematostella vectensis]